MFFDEGLEQVHFEEAGWPSSAPSGLTYDTAGRVPFLRSVKRSVTSRMWSAHQRRVARLVLERIADVAVAPVERAARAVGVEAAAVVLPGDVRALSTSPMLRCVVGGTRDRSTWPTPFGLNAGSTLTAWQYCAGLALRIHVDRAAPAGSRGSARCRARRIRAIEPLRALRVEVERPGLRVGIVDVGRRRRGGMPGAVAVEDLVGEAERQAVGSGAAHDRLVVVVAHRVLVGEVLEERRVAVLHVEERHRLAGVVRRACRAACCRSW